MARFPVPPSGELHTKGSGQFQRQGSGGHIGQNPWYDPEETGGIDRRGNINELADECWGGICDE